MSDVWELYYHPLAGRGEFIRLIFEEAGEPYKEINDRSIVKDVSKLPGYPAFAPPIIRKGDFCLGQTQVCCKYLGKLFGLWPDGDEDIWYADALNTTIHDFIAEGSLVFHGRGFIESYYTQKEETQPYIDWFKTERFAKWMTTLERCLAANNGGHGFAIGNKLTYVDLALLQVLRAADSSFPDTYSEQIDNFPLLKAHRTRIENRPNLQTYFKSERSRAMEGKSMM